MLETFYNAPKILVVVVDLVVRRWRRGSLRSTYLTVREIAKESLGIKTVRTSNNKSKLAKAPTHHSEHSFDGERIDRNCGGEMMPFAMKLTSVLEAAAIAAAANKRRRRRK
jgi:hypothetical protein